jgi:hypothetical protein
MTTRTLNDDASISGAKLPVKQNAINTPNKTLHLRLKYKTTSLDYMIIGLFAASFAI